jgi:hypothetical protein
MDRLVVGLLAVAVPGLPVVIAVAVLLGAAVPYASLPPALEFSTVVQMAGLSLGLFRLRTDANE